MKIMVYDKFKSFKDFLKICKGIYKKIDSLGCEIDTMNVYLNLRDKSNGESAEIVRNSDILGAEVGEFPFIERDCCRVVCRFVPESEMLTRSTYSQECFIYQKQKELSAILPIYRYANNGKVKKFETMDEINKAHYSCNKILIAIQNGTAYRDCIWKRGETID